MGTSRDVYHARNARAALAFRTAVGCTLLVTLIFAPFPWSRDPNYAWLKGTAILAPAFTFVIPARDRGDTMKVGVVMLSAAVVHTTLGLLTAYLCFWLGGLRWQPWILAGAMPFLCLLVVVWAQVAQDKIAPQPLLFGNAAGVFLALLPVGMAMSPRLPSHDAFGLLEMGLAGSAFVALGAVVALLFAYLPLGSCGSPAGWRKLYLLTADNLHTLADYIDKLSLFGCMAPASLENRRAARLDALKTTAKVHQARKTLTFELCERSCFEASIGRVTAPSEACRISLMTVHHFKVKTFSSDSQTATKLRAILFRGPIHEARLLMSGAAARALRAAASLLAHLAGAPSVAEIPHEPRYGAGYSDAAECCQAAQECRSLTRDFRLAWEEYALFEAPQRIREMQGRPRGETADAVRDFMAASSADAQVNEFLDVCLVSGIFLAMCSAAEAAAGVAEAAAAAASDKASGGNGRDGGETETETDMETETETEEAEARELDVQREACCSRGNAGALAWLSAPCAGCDAWRTALKKSRSYALQLAVGVFAAAALGLSLPGIWPRFEPPGFWAVITVSVCVVPVQGAAVLKTILRLAGTVFGAALGMVSRTISDDYLVLWAHVLIVAFTVKFFERELQYNGLMTFITYLLVIAPSQSSASPLLFAAHRIADIAIGCFLVVIVSVFITPNRGIDTLRNHEKNAILLAREAVEATCKTLSRASSAEIQVSHIRTTTLVPAQKGQSVELEALQARTWECLSKLFFAGDGNSGVGDTLSDVAWESRLGSDGGASCCGLLWIPGWPCCQPCVSCVRSTGPDLMSGKQCLTTVPLLSRLLRQCHFLISLLAPGLEAGAQSLLSDEQVVCALQDEGKDSVAAVVGHAAVILSACLGHEFDSESQEYKQSTLTSQMAKVKNNLHLLLLGAAESRRRAGGAMQWTAETGSSGAGGLRAMAVFAVLQEVLSTFELVSGVLEDPLEACPAYRARAMSEASSLASLSTRREVLSREVD